MANLVLLDHMVQQELVALKVLQALMASKEYRVQLVLLEHRVLRVPRA
jgi:hypothetical protein